MEATIPDGHGIQYDSWGMFEAIGPLRLES